MDPFNQQQNTNIIVKQNPIEIWVETSGRKKNTYLAGWNVSNETLKEHLKAIKKKNGCNGSVKEIKNETSDEKLYILQFQGDHSEYVIDYLVSIGVSPEIIKIKG